jgi:hypothetical protein
MTKSIAVRKKEPIMNFASNQNVSGSVGIFADEFIRVCQDGTRTPEENRRLKAELDFKIMKRRAVDREHRMAELKEAVRRKLNGEISDE